MGSLFWEQLASQPGTFWPFFLIILPFLLASAFFPLCLPVSAISCGLASGFEELSLLRPDLALQQSHCATRGILGPDHSNVAAVLSNLALLYKLMDKYEEAEPLYHRALDIWKKALGPKHQNTERVRKKYIEVLRLLKRETEADELKGI